MNATNAIDAIAATDFRLSSTYHDNPELPHISYHDIPKNNSYHSNPKVDAINSINSKNSINQIPNPIFQTLTLDFGLWALDFFRKYVTD